MHVLLRFQLTRNIRFYWNMDNFKFSFFSRRKLESLILDKIFLTLFKKITMLWGFLVALFFPLLLECSAEIIFKV